MTAKTQIVDLLGEKTLVLPALLDAALAANERAKYVLSLLQMAMSQAESPQAAAPSLRAEREACGVSDASFDHAVAASESDGDGNIHVPGARRLVAILDEALAAMIAPLALVPDASGKGDLAARYRERLQRLLAARPPITDDTISGDSIVAMSSGRPAAGDGIHVLVMDLHQEINRLQAAIATIEVAGAHAYGIAESDRPLITAFMKGVSRTAPLKFDHPGLDTMAARSGDTLLLQNDIGTTEAHVLVIKVIGMLVLVTYTDVHAPRIRFFQGLFDKTGLHWEELRSRQVAGLGEDDLFYLALGRFEALDEAALLAFLEHLGSRLVFLIDWNKARKRLGAFVPNEKAVEILTWAAATDIGHRGFLKLGGERLVYDALEQAVRTPLRYGEPLYEMIGIEVATEFLRYVLQVAAAGLLQGQSEALLRDRIRAELFNHFHSAAQRLLGEGGSHAAIIGQLAGGLRAALRQSGEGRVQACAKHAVQAKQLESRADEVVKTIRATVRRIPGTEIFCQMLEIADDAADDLEDAAFLAGLLGAGGDALELPVPLLVLADLLVEGAQAYRRTVEAAQYVHRGSEREAIQRFLEAADRLVTIEHQTDDRERAVTVALVGSSLEAKHLFLLSRIAHHLEAAADSLLHAGWKLRDHVLGDVMFA